MSMPMSLPVAANSIATPTPTTLPTSLPTSPPMIPSTVPPMIPQMIPSTAPPMIPSTAPSTNSPTIPSVQTSEILSVVKDLQNRIKQINTTTQTINKSVKTFSAMGTKIDELMANNAREPDNKPPSFENINTSELVGEGGLNRLMKFDTMPYNKETGALSYRYNFEYKDESKYGRIFSPNEIGKYSGKIKNICDSIINSIGIVMVYTQYIDGGVIPLALALEELGFTRGDTAGSLLKNKVKKIDAITFLTQTEHSKIEGAEPFSPAKYIMITGDKGLSPNNADIIKKVNEESNKDGRKIKVVLISQAGSEGLDYKCIRQVHVMDPWYNMSRIEQIIGRAVRTCSHKNLPFEKRNVEIYLYGSLLLADNTVSGSNREGVSMKEAVDLYVYRLAELKAVQIGNVSRILKEVSIGKTEAKPNLQELLDQQMSKHPRSFYITSDETRAKISASQKHRLAQTKDFKKVK
jgi:hypothetical protein